MPGRKFDALRQQKDARVPTNVGDIPKVTGNCGNGLCHTSAWLRVLSIGRHTVVMMDESKKTRNATRVVGKTSVQSRTPVRYCLGKSSLGTVAGLFSSRCDAITGLNPFSLFGGTMVWTVLVIIEDKTVNSVRCKTLLASSGKATVQRDCCLHRMHRQGVK